MVTKQVKCSTIMERFTNINDRSEVIKIMEEIKKRAKIVYSRKIGYYNIPISFDIETSSFIDYGVKSLNYTLPQKVGIMYVWMLNINGKNIVGRTWDEFHQLLDYICTILKVNEYKRLVIYIHNLGYEFGFISSHFKWLQTQQMRKRKPYKAISLNGIEFRCSYFLSGYKLEKVGENLKYHNSRKAVGKLNYDLIRHTETPLSDDEIEYCLSDVEVCTDYISEMIDFYGDISKIPNTKTGRVRRLFRQRIFDNKTTKLNYKSLMKTLTINNIQEYQQMKAAFMGGFTHCNPFHSNRTINDITLKIDFTSSYPYVMVSENGYPMGKGREIKKPTNEQFQTCVKNYACIFTLIMVNVKCIFPNDNYISASKCIRLKTTDIPLNNGRVVDADYLSISITNVDYEIIKRCYSCEKEYIVNLWYYPRGYLPKPFIEVLLELYKDKTVLKGVEGKEAEYLNSKENLNSSYGMSVTNIIRDEIEFLEKEWISRKLTDEEVIDKISEYNNDEDRFLFYPWGVFITAFARKNLWNTILIVGDDYVYSDTDSLVMLRPQRHINYVKKYNNHVINKLKRASKHFDIPIEYFMPETIKGEIKPMGVWDIEDVCFKFKSLGSKRYLYLTPDTKNKIINKEYKKALSSLLTDNPNWFYFESFQQSGKHTKLSFTVAGVKKDKGGEYLGRNGIDKAFEEFNTDLIIPKEYSGKSVLSYINEPRSGYVKDYLGNVAYYEESSCIYFEQSEYSFGLDDMYIEWIFGLQQIA